MSKYKRYVVECTEECTLPGSGNKRIPCVITSQSYGNFHTTMRFNCIHRSGEVSGKIIWEENS